MSGQVSEVRLQRQRYADATDLFALPAAEPIQIRIGQALEAFNRRLVEIQSDVEELKALESLHAELQDERKLGIQKDVLKSLNEQLTQHFTDKYVAISYDGKVIAAADTDIELLKKIQKSGYVADEIFLHKVGSAAFAGWT